MAGSESDADVALVTNGAIEVEGRLVEASNITLYCTIEMDGRSANVVYKPVAGERPLWDFPDGTLAGREVATYLISQTSGLGAVPPTVLREGPIGEGMVQLWVDTGGDELVDVWQPDQLPDGWLPVLYAHDRSGDPVVLAHADRPDVAELALLDVVVNNTDRKGSHVLHGADGRAYGVDHGICLHQSPKLRTVLWGWSGAKVPEAGVEKLRKLRVALDGELGEQLVAQLTAAEIRSVADRVDLLLRDGVFPVPDERLRAVPWPLL